MGYRSSEGSIRMVLVGDVMPSRRLTPYDEPPYVALVDLLRGADLSLANLETTVRTRDEGVPAFTQGTPMSTDPALLDDLKWMGIDMVGCANNHATDYGVGGIEATIRHLSAARIPFAGIGHSLGEARSPAYCETAAGRVGMVAATAFFRPGNQAANQRPDARGRPGVNPLRFSRDHHIDDEGFAALRRLSDRLGLDQEHIRHKAHFYSTREAAQASDDRFDFMGASFRRSDRFAITTSVNRDDAEANLKWIREARRRAEWVVFSFHFHEFGSGGALEARTDPELEDPADFAVAFAREAIDAGADVVACHGPHLTLGLEIHAGRPILYGLGNFIFQNDTVERFPAEAYERFGLDAEATPADFLDKRTDDGRKGFPASPEYWHGCAAECVFERGRLIGLTLHPLDLGHGSGRGERGRPLLAQGETARTILERLQRLSTRFGTEIEIVEDTGRVCLG